MTQQLAMTVFKNVRRTDGVFTLDTATLKGIEDQCSAQSGTALEALCAEIARLFYFFHQKNEEGAKVAEALFELLREPAKRLGVTQFERAEHAHAIQALLGGSSRTNFQNHNPNTPKTNWWDLMSERTSKPSPK